MASPPENSHRVSYADIAAKANVCKMTVSRVLRGNPRVNPEIASRVIDVAKELGYVPNPQVSQLMTYLRGIRRSSDRGVIGYINCHNFTEEGSYEKYFRRYINGAKSRAADLGYIIEEFNLFDPGFSSERLGQILYSRGIKGVIFSPISRPDKLPDWSSLEFATVSIGAIDKHPEHLTVAHDPFGAIETARNGMLAGGWKRTGLFLIPAYEEFYMRSWQAGFWTFSDFHSMRGAQRWIYILPSYQANQAEEGYNRILAWIESNSLDSVICNFPYRLLEHLENQNVVVGRDFGICGLDWIEHLGQVAGVDQCYAQQGAIAVEMVAKKIESLESGPSHWASSLSHSGVWKRGRTA